MTFDTSANSLSSTSYCEVVCGTRNDSSTSSSKGSSSFGSKRATSKGSSNVAFCRKRRCYSYSLIPPPTNTFRMLYLYIIYFLTLFLLGVDGNCLGQFVCQCGSTVSDGYRLGEIAHYEFNGPNSVNPINWLTSVSATLAGNGVDNSNNGTAYIYNNTNGNLWREYLFHITDGSKDLYPSDAGMQLVDGQKYTRVKTEVDRGTGNIFLCIIEAKIYWTNTAPGNSQDAITQYHDTISVDPYTFDNTDIYLLENVSIATANNNPSGAIGLCREQSTSGTSCASAIKPSAIIGGTSVPTSIPSAFPTSSGIPSGIS